MQVTATTPAGANTAAFTLTRDDMSWEAMRDLVIATRSLAPADAWYAAHTGIGSVDIVTDIPGVTDPGPLTIDDLTPGSLASTHDGQIFVGIRGPAFRVNHNHVTYLRCLADVGNTRGGYYTPASGDTLGGTRLESCTLAYPYALGDPRYAAKDPGYWAQRRVPDGQMYATTLRRCHMSGWAGGTNGFKLNVEYCWSHRLQYAPGVHINHFRLQGDGGRLYRNYGVGGNSGVMSMYFDKEPTANLEYVENIMTGELRAAGNLNPHYLVNLKNGAYGATATGIRIVGNLFGSRASAPIAGGPVRWGQDGNQLGPNLDIATGLPVRG